MTPEALAARLTAEERKVLLALADGRIRPYRPSTKSNGVAGRMADAGMLVSFAVRMDNTQAIYATTLGRQVAAALQEQKP